MDDDEKLLRCNTRTCTAEINTDIPQAFFCRKQRDATKRLHH